MIGVWPTFAVVLVALVFQGATGGLIGPAAFYARRNAMPSQIQAGVYSAVRHYLQAIKDADSNDSATVMARMKATPVSDAYTPNCQISCHHTSRRSFPPA
jgi:hypothetical protein